jgi:hypothetical protein
MYDTSEEPEDTDFYNYPNDVEAGPSLPHKAGKPTPKLGEIPGVRRGVAPAVVPPTQEVTGIALDIF